MKHICHISILSPMISVGILRKGGSYVRKTVNSECYVAIRHCPQMTDLPCTPPIGMLLKGHLHDSTTVKNVWHFQDQEGGSPGPSLTARRNPYSIQATGAYERPIFVA